MQLPLSSLQNLPHVPHLPPSVSPPHHTLLTIQNKSVYEDRMLCYLCSKYCWDFVATRRVSMTQLQIIGNNDMSLECRCGHKKLVFVNELIKRLSPSTKVYENVRQTKCSNRDTKGAYDFRLLYFCGRLRNDI